MPTKKQIKKTAENIIEKELGVRLYKLKGEIDCQVAPYVRTSWNGEQYMVGHIAASLLTDIKPSEITRVTHTCGIENCVAPHHLVVNGEPLNQYKDEPSGVFKAKQDQDAPDQNGDIHGCSPQAWEAFNEYQKSLARTGKYTQVEIGWMLAPKE